MRFHFSCTRNPHTEREVYTMRTPRLRLLSAILAVALFFTLLPVSALAEGGGSTGVSHVATRSLNTDNKDDQGLTYTLHADHTATVANYDNSTPDGVIDIPDTVKKDNIDYTVTAIGNNAFCHSITKPPLTPESCRQRVIHSSAGIPTIPTTPQSLTSALPSRAIPKFTPSGKRTRLSFRIPMR